LTFAPALMASDAQVWRRSCSRTALAGDQCGDDGSRMEWLKRIQ
jgi:hypothetical protein